jgi:diguanylate cyclase (GGDEF)-like protein/PAS domain S-box-containing protein
MPEHLPALIDVFDPEGRPLTVEQYPLMRTLRGEDVSSADVLVGPAGGPYREVVVRGSQITGSHGEVIGAVAALSDVTAERAAARALDDERRKLIEAQRLGKMGSFEHDVAAGTWTFSNQLCDLWGEAPGGLTDERCRSLIVEQDRPLAREAWQSALRQGGHHSYEYRIRRADDGAERLIRSNVEVEHGGDGRPGHARGTHLDITELAVAEQAARRANAFFDAVLTASPDYTFVTDLATGAILYRSPGKAILGLTTEDLEALDSDAIAALVHPEDRPALAGLMPEVRDLHDGQSIQLRYRSRHVDGRWNWLSHSVTPFRRDERGVVVEVLAVVRDVTDLVEVEERLTHAARHDHLTGLPNRAHLLETLDAALDRSGIDGREVAVLFCDLDGFKRVNDTGGHSSGDAVLTETARRLRAVLRKEDTVARVGGDEFVVVVEPWSRGDHGSDVHTDASRIQGRALAVRVAERVIEALRPPIIVKGVRHVVTTSIGITYATRAVEDRSKAATADEVLHDADAAMYRAKDRGKNRFELARQDIFEPAEHPTLPLTVGRP